MKFELFDIISVSAVASYFMPLLIVVFKKLWRNTFFLLFAAYWAIGGLINMTDLIPNFPQHASYIIGVLYNMLDIPLILTILYFTSGSILIRKFTSISLIIYIIIEIINAFINGISYEAIKYTLGTGVALVLIVVIWEIVRYLQKIEHSNSQNAKIFIYAGLLFEYGTFVLIYIFDYFIQTTNREDTFLIYYISSLIAIFIASCGYLLFKKYEKKRIT